MGRLRHTERTECSGLIRDLFEERRHSLPYNRLATCNNSNLRFALPNTFCIESGVGATDFYTSIRTINLKFIWILGNLYYKPSTASQTNQTLQSIKLNLPTLASPFECRL